MRAIQVACPVILTAMVAGCGAIVHVPAPAGTHAAWMPTPSHLTSFLLGAGEGEDIDEIDAATVEEQLGTEEPGEAAPAEKAVPPEEKVKITPPPEVPAAAAEPRKGGGFALRVGLGMAMPGSGAIGSAPGRTIAAYSDIWTEGTAVEAVAEFGGRTIRPFAGVSMASFAGRQWTNPTNVDDSWIASEGTVTSVVGGAKFQLGKVLYAKAAVGLTMLPEMSRIDFFTGKEDPILDASSTFGYSVGAGVELAIKRLHAYVDAEFASSLAPDGSATEDAMLHWPQFEAGGVSVMKVTGGISLSF